MLNTFLKYDAAKSSLVKLGAAKLADIIILAVALTIAAPHIRDYFIDDVKEDISDVKDSQTIISKNQAVILREVEQHGRKIDSTNAQVEQTAKKQDIIINAMVDNKSSIELLKDLYKSGVPGWTFYPVKKKTYNSQTPLELALKTEDTK